ncbi:hypothetical protein PUNSTDRAFT_119620 [Punctularia strigosozonata HHB-11173 SS5]|uniref:uncharacterized protein n=1 Tax=Punctularia strigosozonata (strain HHB-11173) TaxID=741275 RepID=UPI00044170F2|nr:uncharacterized protein PUNSTDRAFT_119620 [Punctularia strigosozonata HHB-11173 SS5]EIN10724.1 hypothetical protein PUNSTDRAFT_119620 [Punctularia strigosozonata HHB-11173 SS5]
MEKYSAFRDPGTGIQPFLTPVPPIGNDLPVKILLPVGYVFGAIRALVLLAVSLASFVLVRVALLVTVPVPALHRILRRIFVAIFARTALFLSGIVWIPVEIAPRKRTKLQSKGGWTPAAGDIIVSNWVSWLEVLWLAFRFDPQFVLPIADAPVVAASKDATPITSTPGRRTGTGSAAISSSFRAPTPKATIRGWTRVSLLTMLRQTGLTPPYALQQSPHIHSLDDIRRSSNRPIVVFPECTTSNGRGLLRFADVFKDTVTELPVRGWNVWVMCVRYDPPTAFHPTLSRSIPSNTTLNPLPHVLSLVTSLVPLTSSIRLLPASESPNSRSFLQSEVLPGRVDDKLSEACAALIAQVGKMKRVGMGWEDKAAFLELYNSKR